MTNSYKYKLLLFTQYEIFSHWFSVLLIGTNLEIDTTVLMYSMKKS